MTWLTAALTCMAMSTSPHVPAAAAATVIVLSPLLLSGGLRTAVEHVQERHRDDPSSDASQVASPLLVVPSILVRAVFAPVAAGAAVSASLELLQLS